MTLPTQAANDDPLALLDPRQQARLHEYLESLLQNTKLFNLTAIRDRDEAWNRHVVESLRLVPLLEDGKTLIDVGSGGGLPGIVLAIARPDVTVTLLEATEKKARFLEQTGVALQLENLHVLCERAEVVGAPGAAQRERFDIVTARAVAPLRVLLELTAPLAKVGGLLLAVKGEKAAAELEAAARALRELHVAHEQTVRQPTASVVLLRKRAATPAKYPRRSGEPARNPL
ncbi:MAG: 16S rRNA (guanine(527)-N(7))-methyltransferase RsmG [Polyangiaceae bacterium]